MTKYIPRDKILGASDVSVAELEVPEWGGTILVRELTTAEVENFSLRTQDRSGQLNTARMAGLRAEIVTWCVVDEDGNQVFEKGDEKALQLKSHRVIDRVFNKTMELSGLKDNVVPEGEADEKKE